jgi:Holliday junction resolvase RusA-like endonuclease
MIEFFVPVTIVPKQSDRTTIRNGRIRHYQPKQVTANAKTIAFWVRRHVPAEPLTGPIAIEVRFAFPWPASVPEGDRRSWRPKDTKPDLDNCVKQFLDVLQSCGMFKNDAQVWHTTPCKVWDNKPGIKVKIWRG